MKVGKVKESAMKKLAVPALAALMAMNVSLAFAWSDVSGVIKSIDMQKHELVLDNGKTYMLENTVNPATFKAGDKVRISTQVENGKNMVNKVTRTS